MRNLHLIEKWILHKVKGTAKLAAEANYNKYYRGESLRILIIGYGGKKNIGAEIRCAEIIKQIKYLNLPVSIEFGVLTLDPSASRPFYSSDVNLIKISSIFFEDLLKHCSNYHIGVLAEGSCLTSVTSNVSALFFACAAGILKSQNKLCIGYGVESGPMPRAVSQAAAELCSNSYFIARTKNSKLILDKLCINNEVGTDTAWKVEAASDEWAKSELHMKFGIDNGTFLIGISPMNPYIRPIYPSITRYIRAKFTNDWNGHYDKIYFYTISKERDQLYKRYLTAIRKGFQAIKQRHAGSKVVYIEMEPMDKAAVEDLRKLSGEKGFVISANDYTGVEMTALLRQLSMLITSRYHAHVLSMPAGVPCVAISKDNRLTDIFHHNDLAAYCLSTQDPHLEHAVPLTCTKAYLNHLNIKATLIDKVPYYIQIQDEMGEKLKEKITQYVQYSPKRV